ncbi:MAG: TRAP transporter small permease [Spirochaetes bacterium]|nr:TRAP transporter small permease [Spirochaetota bacterium]
MKKLIRFGIWLEETSSQILLGFVVVLVFIAALTRYLGTPINWSVDIAQGIFVWVIYLGANQAWRKNRHIGIDMLFNRFHPQVQNWLTILIYGIILVFLAMIIVNGIHIAIVNVGRIMNDIPISYSFVTIAVPMGSFLMFLTTVEKLISLLRTKSKG